MSRSKNERSVPNMRGRHGEMKAKRRSHKIARKLSFDTSNFELNMAYVSVTLDRETKQKDVGRDM